MFFFYYSIEDFRNTSDATKDATANGVNEYIAEIKTVLLLMSIVKLMQLIRLYDNFGILI